MTLYILIFQNYKIKYLKNVKKLHGLIRSKNYNIIFRAYIYINYLYRARAPPIDLNKKFQINWRFYYV